MKACQNYIEQSDFENKDFFNKTKLEKLLDSIRDQVYVLKIDLKQTFIKTTESDSDNYDKSVMTLDHFGKFIRITVGDKISNRE